MCRVHERAVRIADGEGKVGDTLVEHRCAGFAEGGGAARVGNGMGRGWGGRGSSGGRRGYKFG